MALQTLVSTSHRRRTRPIGLRASENGNGLPISRLEMAMAYAPAPIQSIKSSNQRALLAQWQTLSAGRSFPDIGEFTPPERDLKQLVLWDVEDDGVVRRFRMRKLGQAAAEGFAGDYTGKTMDEVVPEPLRS